jgi:IS30 family transposase
MTGKGHPLSPAERATAARLLDDGASYREVARTLGRSDLCIGRNFPGRSQWRQGSTSVAEQTWRKQLDAIHPVTA